MTGAAPARDVATGAAGAPALEERRALQDRLQGYQASAVLYVAARLGIADLLADGSRTADDLARATGCDTSALRRVLRDLAALGVVEERSDGAVALSRAGSWLRRDDPLSLQPLALLARINELHVLRCYHPAA